MPTDGVFTLGMDYKGRRYAGAEAGLLAFARNMGRSLNGVDEEIKEELGTFLRDVAGDVARAHSTQWTAGAKGGQRLYRRSGRGMRSVLASVRVTGEGIGSVQGEIGGESYLRIQEYGGTVRAKNVKYLTIPLPAALKPDGTPKRQSARDWPGTFVITSKAGNKLICMRDGKTLVPLYVLKEQVRIPARLGMRSRLQRDVPRFAERAMARALRRIQANV